MLVAGPVVFGACAVKRQTETTRQASADIAIRADRSGLRLDSLTGIRDRSLVLERRWEHILPETGAVYRYGEQVRLTDRDSVAVSRALGVQSRLDKAVQVDTQEHRSVEREVSGNRWRWLWWALGAAVSMWLARKAIRLWPFR